MLIVSWSAITLMACTSPTPKISEPAQAKRGNGYTDVETENVKLVKKLNEASLVNLDSAATLAFYSSSTDTIHDNLDNMTVAENIQVLPKLKKAGFNATIDSYEAIWETINDSANAKGQTNFVIAYMTVTINKGQKSAKFIYNQVCAVKNGKVVEEWDVYDTKPLSNILK